MNQNQTSLRGKVSIGRSVGLALADRLIELARPDAIIVDNRATVIYDRRKGAALEVDGTTPRRRSTDTKPSE